jgi:tetratricopeptide (TPR) repeat protein
MPDTSKNVRFQNLRDFTVQIRDAKDQIIGTGIAISTDGQILTCAHVVEETGINPRAANGEEVCIYFPQAPGGEQKKRNAKVAGFFPLYDDDMVLLQLDGDSPLAPEQVAVLGTSDGSETNPFLTYGYSSVGNYPASRADGKILGSVEPPVDRTLQVDPIQLQSRQIAGGMSGSAVLDTERNLVVGLIAERYFPESSVQDDIGFSVDSKVLTFPPFSFKLRGESLELRPAPSIKLEETMREEAIQIAQLAREERSEKEKYSWHNAPSVLKEWTGRDHLLEQITEDWNDPKKHVTGLIGFGGEGKSSLARKWVDSLPLTSGEPSSLRSEGASRGPGMGVDGLFWWGFYENRSVDEFLEAALKYMSGGRIDPRAVPSSNLKAQIIGAMLGTGKYLFVLDGLEVMQHQEGDQYGLLQSNDLRDLLTFFARPDNQSFCLITSRAPLLDLMDYTTYTHRDVERLSEEDGRALLRRLGIQGSDDELDQVVADWDGHALTLSILAAYLTERYEGDIKHLEDIPLPTADESRYERVHRVLRRYDEHLTEEEREFLKLFSVFRLPVQESAFEKVFKPLLVGATRESPLPEIVNRLATYRLIRHDEQENAYTTHPLIRNHYFALFTKGDSSQEKAAHEHIKDYYLSIAGDTPQYPTLDDLKPLVEAVHHACQAGEYDEALDLHSDRIEQVNKFVFMHQLGAFETELTICTEYFPERDISQEPLLSRDSGKRWILAMIGGCLMGLGRLREAVQFYERKNELYEKVSAGYQNLADLHADLGALEASAEAARQALDLARKADDKDQQVKSMSRQARAEYKQGHTAESGELFKSAETLEREYITNTNYLTRDLGIMYAEQLRRSDEIDLAIKMVSENLKFCETNRWSFIVSMCHRVIGDLDSDAGNYVSAYEHYESALKIARVISVQFVLIEALLARGRFLVKTSEVFAKHPRNAVKGAETSEVSQAFNDLNEALGYCLESGYRIYEADVRVALAWAYLANGEKEKAKASAERALQMSNEMGYHWGKVDAEEVLKAISG